MRGRRDFQVGPSRYTIEAGMGGWYVVEHWWQMRNDGEEEDMNERISGPHTHSRAHQRSLELPERAPCHD